MLQHVLGFPSFLRLHNVLLYIYATFCLFIHLSVDTWVASTPCPLWLTLWTQAYSSYLLFWVCSSCVRAQVNGPMPRISLEALVPLWFQFTCLSCELSSWWAPDKLRFCILFSFFSLWWWEWFLGAFSISSGNPLCFILKNNEGTVGRQKKNQMEGRY